MVEFGGVSEWVAVALLGTPCWGGEASGGGNRQAGGGGTNHLSLKSRKKNRLNKSWLCLRIRRS